MTGYRVAAAVLVFSCGVSAAQSNEWPSLLSVPEKTDTAVDSTRLHLSSDAKVFENTEKTNSRLDWTHEFYSWQLQQRCIFATTYDRPYGATNQLYDFSGSVMRDSVFLTSGSLGLEWTPVSYLNLRDSGGGFQTTGDFGPVMQWNVRDIPVRIRGGVSGSGWNNNLPPHFVDSRLVDFHGDAGMYGAFSAGNPTVKLFGRPLYVTTEAFVRSVSKVGIAVINGSALYAHELVSGDSLFAYYGDSLSNGKERYWGSTGGQQQYINSPWRIARSLNASGGIKFKERRSLHPAIVYSYSENSVEYPRLSGIPSDVRTRLQSLNLLAGIKGKMPLVYRGGIRIWWGTEEWLFKNDHLYSVADNFHRGNSQKDTLIEDSLTVKLNDHRIYRAMTDHSVGLTLPHGMSLEYKLGMFRDSKTYNFYILDSILPKDTIRRYDDDDAITVNHLLNFKFPQFHGVDAEVYGEYSVYSLNYLKKQRSAANQTENGYLLGLNLSYKPSERFMLSERATADAELFDYLYKKSHLNEPPPYKRRFSSLCMGVWKISDSWEINGRWDENYYDDGVWNGHEYFDSTRADSLGTDYYAINNKTTDYSVELGLAMVQKKFRIESGCRLQDVYARYFSNNTYLTNNGGKGYIVEPFAEFLFTYNWLSLKGRIVRIINTLAPDKAVFRRNWDIHLAGQAAW
jgi:hypothetical protein